MKNAILTKEDTRRNDTAILPHRSLSLYGKLRNEMNKLFDDFNHGFGLWHSGWQESFLECQAKVDVKDVGNDIVISAEVPGVEMHDLDVTATPNYVSLAGEKKAEKEEKEKGFYRMEREYGYFRRVIPMPCEIDKDRVDAVFKNGVLTLTLPKSKAALQDERKVTVKAN